MKENKMGTMSIPKLLINISLPMMISMLIQALYNIVDSMFVAKINESALTAVSLAFPMQNLMIAVSTGTGVGINALLAKSLGEKRFDRANKVAVNALFIEGLSSLIFVVVGLFFSRMFFEIQTTDTQVIEYGISYMSICTILSIGIFMQIANERLLQGTGRTLYSMITQGCGAIINIILDPIMIFGLFGFPQLNVAGAALATVCGQIFAAILGIIINIKYNHDIQLKFKGFKPDLHIIKKIYQVGFPSILMVSISSIMNFGMNQILLGLHQSAAAFFGIYNKLQSFIFMPIFGMNNGMVPIISYNYGAKKKDRIIKTLKLGITAATLIMTIGFALFQFFPDALLQIFNASETLSEIGRVGLRVIAIHFLLAGASIVFSSCFQALGHGMASLIVSAARQLIVLLPVAYLMSLTNNLNLVWWSFPIAEVVSLLICIFFFRRIYHNQIQNI